MVDPTPLRLMPDDRATTLDPEAAGADLMAQVRALVDDALYHRLVLRRTPGVAPDALHQAADLAHNLGALHDAAETLVRAYRTAGLYRVAYSVVTPDTGV